MKKQALVTVGLFVFVAFTTGNAFALQNSPVATSAFTVAAKVTVAEARKIALAKVDGKVEDTYIVEDEDGKAFAHAFVIKNKAGKYVEVQVSIEKGEIISVEEYSETE